MKVLLVALLVSIVVDEGISIRCFQCEYPETLECTGSNINTTLSVECAIDVNTCYVVYSEGRESRKCGATITSWECSVRTRSGYPIYCYSLCGTDLCNIAPPAPASISTSRSTTTTTTTTTTNNNDLTTSSTIPTTDDALSTSNTIPTTSDALTTRKITTTSDAITTSNTILTTRDKLTTRTTSREVATKSAELISTSSASSHPGSAPATLAVSLLLSLLNYAF